MPISGIINSPREVLLTMRYKDGSEVWGELLGRGARVAMAGSLTPGMPNLQD